MAKIIVVTCDPHADRGEDGVPATPRTLSRGLDPHKAEVVVDMCDDCDKELLEPIRQLIDAYGQTTHGAPPQRRTRRATATQPALSAHGDAIDRTDPGIYICPLEGCPHGEGDNDPYVRRTSFNVHAQRDHGTTLQALEAEYGNINQVADPKWQRYLTQYKCRWCDETFPKTTARGRHEASMHPDEFEEAGGPSRGGGRDRLSA